MKNTVVDNKHPGYEKLSQYFSQAADMEPVADIKEIECLIKNAGGHLKLTQKSKSVFTLKFKIAMTSSIIVISAFIVSLFYNTHNRTSALLNKEKSKSKISQNKHIATSNNVLKNRFLEPVKNDERQFRSSSNIMLPLQISSPDESFWLGNNFSNYSDLLSIKEKPFIKLDEERGTILPDKQEIKPLELTMVQLERLGIKATSKGLEYNCKVEDWGVISYVNGKKGLNIFVDNIQSNDKEKTVRKIVLKTTNRRSDHDDIPKMPAINFTSDFYPVFISPANGEEFLKLNIDSLLKRQMPGGGNDTSSFIKAIPVLVKQNDFKGFAEKNDLVFWFKATPSFLEVMKDFYPGNLNSVAINRTWNKSEEEMYNAEKLDASVLQNIKPLELSADQMKKLGFNVKKNGLEYKANLKNLGKLEYSFGEMGIKLNVKTRDALKIEGKDYYPVFISDLNGVQFFKYMFNSKKEKGKWTDGYFLSTIRTLVPVLVRQKIYGYKNGKDMIFWFNITPSFLKVLPDSISTDMGKEYNKLTEKSNSINDSLSSNTCKYFDVCQLPLEKAMKVNIYPNPAQLLLNVEFELSPNTTATLCMTDLGGKVVKSMQNTYTSDGPKHVEIETGNLRPGIYLVLLKLNNGITLSNKVVVNSKE